VLAAQCDKERCQVDARHAVFQGRAPQGGVVVGQRAYRAAEPGQFRTEVHAQHGPNLAPTVQAQQAGAVNLGHHGALEVTHPMRP